MSTRQFSRVRFRIEATVSAAGRTFAAALDNVSLNGVFLATDERPVAGEAVTVTADLPGSTPPVTVTFSGVVSRTTDSGIAVRFTAIDLESLTHLRTIVAYNLGDAEAVADEIGHSRDRVPAADSGQC